MANPRTSVRLFESDFLERFSFAGPGLITAVWAPLIAVAAVYGVTHADVSAGVLAAVAATAALGWTLFEYAMHRFVFHLRATSPLGKWLLFVMHGCHHVDPQDKRRNVLTPAVTLSVGALILALLVAIAGAGLGAIAFAGFTAGYLAYDLVHYACHQLDMPGLRGLKRRHLAHHFAGQEANFAVTFPLWDRVFGTPLLQPAARADRGQRHRQRVDDPEHR